MTDKAAILKNLIISGRSSIDKIKKISDHSDFFRKKRGKREDLTQELREKIKGIGGIQSRLHVGAIKITSPAASEEVDGQSQANADVSAESPKRHDASAFIDDEDERIDGRFSHHDISDMESEEDVLVLKAANVPGHGYASKTLPSFRAVSIVAASASVLWCVFCLSYVAFVGNVGLTPHELGAFLAGMFAPPALLWMIVSTLNRKADIHHHADVLRHELHTILFPAHDSPARINSEIEQMCRQAAELSAVSKSALKSLQKARQGLRMEIRDFSGVSKKAEFHIERLATSLGEKSEKLLVLTDEIGARTSTIDKRVQAGAAAWDKATVSVLARAGEMQSVFDRGTEAILSAAEHAEMKSREIDKRFEVTQDGLDETVERMAGRLQDLGSDLDGYTEKLAQAADHVADEVSGLSNTIQLQIDGLETATQQTVDAMAESAGDIQVQKQALDDAARAVALQSNKIAGTVEVSVGALKETVDSVIERTEGLEERLDQKTAALHGVVKGIAKEADLIDEAGQHAANRLGEALSVAVSGAESITFAVNRSVQSLERSTHAAQSRAEELAAETRRQVEALDEAGGNNTQMVKDMVTLLEQHCVHINHVSESIQSHIKNLSQSIDVNNKKINGATESLSGVLGRVGESLSEPLKKIEHAVSEADERHRMIEETLRRRVLDLNDAGEKAATSAGSIRDMLRGQAQEIATLSGKIVGHGRIITERISASKEKLVREVEQSVILIEKAGDSLEGRCMSLGALAKTTAHDIGALSDSLEVRCEAIAESTGKAISVLAQADQSVEQKITTLKRHAEETGRSVLSVKEALLETAQDMGPLCSQAIKQADEVQARFEGLEGCFKETADSTLVQLKKIGIVFDQRLQNLKDGADEARGLLERSGEILKNRVTDIEIASQSGHESIDALSTALSDQVSDIHLRTDQALLKIESVQKLLNEQFHELSASVGQAVEQLKDAGNGLVWQSSSVKKEIDASTKRFSVATETMRDETEALNKASEKTVNTTETLVRQVEREAEALLSKAGETLLELKKTGDTFGIRAREVAEHMKVALQTSESYGRELRQQAAGVAETSAQTAEQISRAAVTLKGTMDGIGKAANDVSVKVERSGERLAGESERLLSISAAALDAANDASAIFTRQSEALFKASRDAVSSAKSIQNSGHIAQRGAFMHSAKFIIESLHSLSVDLTRMLEGDVSEKLWKAFQQGETAAFTHRLVSLSEKWPLEQARDKFAKDSEFRTYVQRFARQFEEMYDQALRCDHGGLLSGTLGSSELGKLYQFLCNVAEKDSRFDRTRGRAA